jgi:hypothetical protein
MRYVLLALMLTACGGGKKAETLGKKTHVDGMAPADAGPGDPAGGADAVPAGPPLTEAECATLYDHIVELALAGAPADEKEDTRAALEANRPDAIEGCQGGKVTRAQHACFMAAKTWDELQACAPKPAGGTR